VTVSRPDMLGSSIPGRQRCEICAAGMVAE
jgi:hypothetical protein